MDTNIALKLNYEQGEVVSAQRMRFLSSNRFKLMIVLAITGTLVLSAQQAWLWFESKTAPVTWYTPVYVLLIFGGVFVIVYLFAPPIDFRLNSQWRSVFNLHLTDNKFRLTVSGQSQGFEMEWEQIKRVLENEKVYILFWGSEQEFVILPKRVLQTQDKYFHDRLNRKVGLLWNVRA